MKKKLSAIIALSMLWPASVGWAKGIYISHGGTGDGSSCASARSEAWVSTAGNWGVDATDISDGDTLWFCDDGGVLTDLITLVGGSGKTYYISPAPGESPEIGPTGQYGMHAGTADRGTFIIDGLNTLTFSGGVGANSTPLRFNSQTGFKVLRCKFTSQTATYAMQAVVATIDAANVEIAYNYFDLADTTDAIRVTHYGAAGKTYHDWSIHDNHAENVKNFFMELPDANVFAADINAYGINFSYNTGEDIKASFFSPGSGIDTNGGASVSYIGHNTTNFCGSVAYTTNNCYQLHNLGDPDGTITIEDNVGYHTYNGDTGDGNFMIFDWADADATKYSQNLIIRRNRAYDYSGSGFSAYRLKNSVMHNNLADGSPTATTPAGDTSEAGFKWAWSDGTGNSAYNNTSINHVAGSAYKISDAALVGNPEVALINNIGVNALIGINVINGSAAPVENHNAIYNVGSNSITLDVTDITDDPHLDSQGRPARNSPVINAGADVGLSYWGPAPEIGAYEVGGYPMKINNIPYTMPVWRLGVQ